MGLIEDFSKLAVRIGTMLTAKPFPEARKSAIKLDVDFGEIGIKQTSAQIIKRYGRNGRIQVTAIVNLPPRRVAGYKSEVLVLGGVPETGDVVLLRPDEPTPNGMKIS